jgi:hypothetical protein
MGAKMSDRDLTRTTGNRSVEKYDPDKGLKSIAVAEAGEKHFARAKDATRLLKAIETKIDAQADYIVWRDRIVPPSQETGGPGRGKRVTEQKPVLPDADPGKVIAHRWRKRFTSKTEGRTALDPEKIRAAKKDAAHRCVRICEQQKDGTVRGTEGTGEFERCNANRGKDCTL